MYQISVDHHIHGTYFQNYQSSRIVSMARFLSEITIQNYCTEKNSSPAEVARWVRLHTVKERKPEFCSVVSRVKS